MRVVLLLFASFVVTSCTRTSPSGRCEGAYAPPPTFPSSLGARLDDVLEGHLEDAAAPGATLTVRVPALGTWVSAAGVRSIATREPVAPLDRFRVGSITKAFTAATMLSLAAEGALSLDDEASAWVPAYGLPDDITIAQLLHHTSGVFDFTDDLDFLSNIGLPWTADMIVAWALDDTIAGHGLVFPAGTAWQYSNTGYHVAGRIIEEATGRPYDVEMRARTIDVAGLDATGLDGYDAGGCDYVDGHIVELSVVTDDQEPSWSWAAGGVVSNGYDLCAWATALYLGDVLSPEDRARMLAVEPLSVGEAMRAYGYGTAYAVRGGVEVVGHTGSTMGFNAELFLHPSSGVCVAVLTNDFFASPREIAQPAWALLSAYTSP